MPEIDGKLSVSDAANRFKISEMRIYRWLESGRITTYRRKFDKQKMVDPAEVQKVLDSLTQIEKEEDK